MTAPDRPTQHAIREARERLRICAEDLGPGAYNRAAFHHRMDALDAAIRADERERCARECETFAVEKQDEGTFYMQACATRIRALGEER